LTDDVLDEYLMTQRVKPTTDVTASATDIMHDISQ